MSELSFNALGQLQLQRHDAAPTVLRNPYTDDGMIHTDTQPEGMWLVFGGRIRPGADASPGTPFLTVDLLNTHDISVLRQWEFDAEGLYLDQATFRVSTMPSSYATPYLLNPTVLSVLQKQLNDYQIYTLLLRMGGTPTAAAYLDRFVSEHPPPTAGRRRCKLVVIYNHHYVRNCPAIYRHYSSRFPDMEFILPCAAPDHPNYHAHPFGSLQFHGLIYSYLNDRRRWLKPADSDCEAYAFIQDDLLLHPSMSSDRILELLDQGYVGIFGRNGPFGIDDTQWGWSIRVRSAIEDQVRFNGFEGMVPAMPMHSLLHGVSDCFVIKSDLVAEFQSLLAPMVAANIFPEVAIPTALFNAAQCVGSGILTRPGRLLWGEHRQLVNDPGYVADFIASDDMFLHPVKVAFENSDTMRLLREAAG